jgi:uncharacterized circularly permuted ATP-grasp superfamily protein/uncharacterized alpha-E superfamily protein
MESNQVRLLHGYHPREDSFDEMLSDGAPRAHWRRLLESFEALGPSNLNARRETALRILGEQGVTYSVVGDAGGLSRLWSLDLVPLMIPPEEWRLLELGLIQRTRLLNLVLADFYGPRQLLREGVLPSALVYANPAFLRPCDGIRMPHNIHLFIHAVDLTRSQDGRWWVLADRTQSPSGAGYALENRVVLSRVLPDEFRNCHVERLARFFQVARDTLRTLAGKPGGQPNVVLLTPGPYNETYFEHVYLSRYLGLPLVEGGDLTVRDRRVFFKTLEGLQPVDVIFRRTDDVYCDPLELRADSILGIPGLVEAARAGNVVIANALGSGVVETPALAAFLPSLARRFLGEDLRLPSVATWWCGQDKELGYVKEHFSDMVIKRAFGPMRGEPMFCGALSAEVREKLWKEVKSSPYAFVGQEQVPLSTVPIWENGRLEPRPMVLRAYVCATPEGFSVMPGGLTRFSTARDRLVVSMQSGGGSKDTWVMTEGPVSQLSLLLGQSQIVRLEKAAAEVPSRVADNLFWQGRYTERLEDTVRVLRSVLVRLTGEAGAEETPELTALIELLVNLDLFPAKFRERHTLAGVEREVYALVFQGSRMGSMREVLGRLNQIAFALRDRFSADTWRILNKMQVDARPQPGRLLATDVLAMLNTMVTNLAAFAGMEMENMTRGHGWRFLDIGRRLERSMNMATLLQGGLSVDAGAVSALEPILEIADSGMTYRRRYLAQPRWPMVLDLLLADESNPRALSFQLAALQDHLSNLPRDLSGGGNQAEMLQIEEIRTVLAKVDFMALVESHFEKHGEELSEFLARVAAELRVVSDALTHRFFSHAGTRPS